MNEILNATISTFERCHELDEQNREVILAALREKAARDNPQPLTLEQLRERIGKPVFLSVPKTQLDEEYAFWALVQKCIGEYVGFYSGAHYFQYHFEEGFIAYDYQPKEDGK